jgi:nucleoside diphosphate kinase
MDTVLIKHDAIEDGCVPTILEYLHENDLNIRSFSEISLSLEDAYSLYAYDEREELNEYEIAGAENLVGKNIIVTLTGLSSEDLWEKLKEIKGQPWECNRTIRSILAPYVPENSSPKEKIRVEVRNRIHVPMTEEEVFRLHNLLVRKELSDG